MCSNIYEIDCNHNWLVPMDRNLEITNLDHFDERYYLEDDKVYHLFYNLGGRKAVYIMRDPKCNGSDNQILLKVDTLWFYNPVGSNIASFWREKS